MFQVCINSNTVVTSVHSVVINRMGRGWGPPPLPWDNPQGGLDKSIRALVHRAISRSNVQVPTVEPHILLGLSFGLYC